MIENLAPLVLFTYNRPTHTKRSLDHIAHNNLADKSTLYIFCDGPKEEATFEDLKAIQEVRKIAKERKWCKNVTVIEYDKNKGLAGSIINGVDQVFNNHDEVIVLEDDLLTSPFFLQYMNQALSYYRNRCSVFSISADRPPYNLFQIPENYKYDVFVSLRFFSTGWATWKDRWQKVDWSMNYMDGFIKSRELVSAFNRGGEDLTQMLINQRENKIDSWAIRFIFAHFQNHAVSILPRYSYIDNIGFDGSGIHSGNNEANFRKDISKAVENPRMLDVLYEDRRIVNSFYSAFCAIKRPIYQKIINRLSRLLGFTNIFIVKKKIYN